MCKVKIVVIFLFMSMFSSYSQKKKFPIAIGVGYEWIGDSERGYNPYQNVTVNYNTKRERLALEALYGLSSRLNMKSAIGVSFYNSELSTRRQMVPVYTAISISELYLLVSQTVLYDLVHFPNSDFFKIKVSPFITMDYEHMYKTNHRKRSRGFSDFNSTDVDDFIERYDIPALGGETSSPIGILSLTGGLSFETILFKKIGVHYNLGYSQALFGHSKIDAKYKYRDNQINTLTYKSKDSGILQKIGLRYYF